MRQFFNYCNNAPERAVLTGHAVYVEVVTNKSGYIEVASVRQEHPEKSGKPVHVLTGDALEVSK